MFSILSFGDGLELLPSKWLTDDDKCFFPPYLSRLRIEKAVQELEEPQDSWKVYNVKCVLGRAVNYQRGIEKLEEAFEKSEREAEVQRHQSKKRKTIHKENRDSNVSSSDLGEDLSATTELPSTPSRQFNDEQSQPVIEINDVPQNAIILSLPEPLRNASRKDNDFQDFVKSSLREIIGKLNGIEQRVKVLEENAVNSKKLSNEETLLDVNTFPVQSIEEFEKRLEDNDFFKKMVNTLKGIGGSDGYTLIVNILKRILTNEVAGEYSLLGLKKKKRFKDLLLYRVVLETVRLHRKEMTEKEYDDIVARWLVQARLRQERAELKKMQNKKNL